MPGLPVSGSASALGGSANRFRDVLGVQLKLKFLKFGIAAKVTQLLDQAFSFEELFGGC